MGDGSSQTLIYLTSFCIMFPSLHTIHRHSTSQDLWILKVTPIILLRRRWRLVP
ncbi:flavin oxidoreductase nadh oxidase, partial [Moniliophthora roreri]